MYCLPQSGHHTRTRTCARHTCTHARAHTHMIILPAKLTACLAKWDGSSAVIMGTSAETAAFRYNDDATRENHHDRCSITLWTNAAYQEPPCSPCFFTNSRCLPSPSLPNHNSRLIGFSKGLLLEPATPHPTAKTKHALTASHDNISTCIFLR